MTKTAVHSTQSAKTTNRRTLAHLILKPLYQMRLGFVVIYLGLATLSATAYLMFRELSKLDSAMNQLSSDPYLTQQITNEVLSNVASYGLGGFASFVFISSVLALVINHRVSGPTLALVQTIDEYIKGNYQYRRPLRQHDELKPIQKRLVQLGEALSAKNENK